MKTIKKMIRPLALLPLVLLLANCSKKDSSSTPTYYMSNGYCYSSGGQIVPQNYCTTSGYYMSNGLCYASNGTTVPTNYCSTVNSGYYMSNGVCYGPGGVVAPSQSYCSTVNSGYYMSNGICYGPGGVVSASYLCSTGTVGAGFQQMVCQGVYYLPSFGTFNVINCYGTNCRGMTLYSQNGQQVYCE